MNVVIYSPKPHVEPIILKDMIRKRWKGMKYQDMDDPKLPEYLFDYYDAIITGRWFEVEGIIKKNPWVKHKYVVKVIVEVIKERLDNRSINHTEYNYDYDPYIVVWKPFTRRSLHGTERDYAQKGEVKFKPNRMWLRKLNEEKSNQWSRLTYPDIFDPKFILGDWVWHTFLLA